VANPSNIPSLDIPIAVSPGRLPARRKWSNFTTWTSVSNLKTSLQLETFGDQRVKTIDLRGPSPPPTPVETAPNGLPANPDAVQSHAHVLVN